jgi:hypothetical protein
MYDLLIYVFHFLAHQIKKFAVEDTDIVVKKEVRYLITQHFCVAEIGYA